MEMNNSVKPRVLQLIDSFDQGGSERQALELTRLLCTSGKYEVFLASLKADGVLRPTIADLKLGEIPSYPLTSFYDRNAVEQLRRFVRYLRASRIDLLHTHDFYTNIFGMTAGFLAGVKVRIASRRDTSGMRSTAQLRAQRMAYSLAHHIVANSQSVRDTLIAERQQPGEDDGDLQRFQSRSWAADCAVLARRTIGGEDFGCPRQLRHDSCQHAARR